jgi:simple sugar transport system permease protein
MSVKGVFRKTEFYILAAILVLGGVITAVNPAFLSLENLCDLLLSYSAVGIMALGVLFVVLSGGIDISFTAIAQVAQYATIAFIVHYGGSVLTAFLLASAIGILMGALNGVIIHALRIPAIIATIATYNVFFGMLYFFSKGHLIINIPDFFVAFSQRKLFTLTNAAGSPYGASVLLLIWLAAIIISWYILRLTSFGRNVYCLGGNPVAARRAGINVLRTQVFIYAYMGFLAGIASMVHFILVLTVIPNSIVGKELEVIAAVVLGGANIVGGTGTILGTVLGVILFAVMSNGLTLMRVSSYWYKVITGVIIVVSVGVSAYQLRLKTESRKGTAADHSRAQPLPRREAGA